MKLLTVFMLAMVYIPHIISADPAAESSPSPPSGCANTCPTTVQPVCGTNNVTYRNVCFLNCASLDSQANGGQPIYIQSVGACPVEACICNAVEDPVCASNGQTFNNRCLFECENRKRYALGLTLLRIDYNGPCVVCKCNTLYDPVCASDKKTYSNTCLFDCENEIRKRKGLPRIDIVFKGVCGCNCTPHYDPLCANDRKTYNNKCLFDCENEKRAHQGQDLLYILHRGPCVCYCPNCSNIRDLVCGSDGRTYLNICWLRCYSNCSVANGGQPINYVKPGYC